MHMSDNNDSDPGTVMRNQYHRLKTKHLFVQSIKLSNVLRLCKAFVNNNRN